MEVFGVQSKNLTCMWNDVALLTDQRACTFLCKAMLMLSEEEAASLQHDTQQIQLKEWKRQSSVEEYPYLTGSATLEIACSHLTGEQKLFLAELPLSGRVKYPITIKEDARLLYSSGRFADTSLLIEFVLQIPQELHLKRTQVIAGQFDMEELLELPEPWPDCAEVLTTAAVAEVQNCTVNQQKLLVEGQYLLTVVYADETQRGECLFAWQQHRPLQWAIPVPAGLQDLTGVQPYYQSLAVQLLDTRRIQLTGSGVVCTLPDDSTALQQEEWIVETDDEEEKRKTDSFAEQKVQSSPSVINSRGSRRANLSRYMRDLNGMGQSPTSVRNFEIGQEPEETEKI